MKAKEQHEEFDLKLIESRENRKEVGQGERLKKKQGVTRLLREEYQGVLVDTIITPKVAPRGEHTVVQAHLLPESTVDLEWMN